MCVCVCVWVSDVSLLLVLVPGPPSSTHGTDVGPRPAVHPGVHSTPPGIIPGLSSGFWDRAFTRDLNPRRRSVNKSDHSRGVSGRRVMGCLSSGPLWPRGESFSSQLSLQIQVCIGGNNVTAFSSGARGSALNSPPNDIAADPHRSHSIRQQWPY